MLFLYEVSIQKVHCNELASTVSAPIRSKAQKKVKKSNAKVHEAILPQEKLGVFLIYDEWSDRGGVKMATFTV